VQFRVTDTAAADIFTGAMRSTQSVDAEALMRDLKTFNERLLNVRATLSAEVPDYTNVLLPVLAKANEQIDHRMRDPKYQELDLSEIKNVRLKGDIIRELRAYKLLRLEVSNEELKNWGLARTEHFFDFAMQPIIAREYTGARAHESTQKTCFDEIMQLTKTHALSRNEILDALQKKGYSRTTIDRALKYINDSKLNKSKDFGLYET
jgi:hypothetical protein